MKAKDLEEFGLTQGEAKVYLALLRIGKSTIGSIIKEAQVSNSKVYDILERLNEKGLVGVVTEKNKKSFEAKSPEILKENLIEKKEELENKEKDFNELLPVLNDLFQNKAQSQEVEVLKGVKGMKTTITTTLNNTKKGDTIYVLGTPKQSEILTAFLLDWHKKRISKSINCKLLYNYEAKDLAKQRQKMKFTEAKVLPKELISPVVITFNNQETTIQVFSDNPSILYIKSKEVANNYKNYFDYLWNISKY